MHHPLIQFNYLTTLNIKFICCNKALPACYKWRLQPLTLQSVCVVCEWKLLFVCSLIHVFHYMNPAWWLSARLLLWLSLWRASVLINQLFKRRAITCCIVNLMSAITHSALSPLTVLNLCQLLMWSLQMRPIDSFWHPPSRCLILHVLI